MKLKALNVRTNTQGEFDYVDICNANRWKIGTPLARRLSSDNYVTARLFGINRDYLVIKLDGSGRLEIVGPSEDWRELDETPEPAAEPVKIDWPEMSGGSLGHVTRDHRGFSVRIIPPAIPGHYPFDGVVTSKTNGIALCRCLFESYSIATIVMEAATNALADTLPKKADI